MTKKQKGSRRKLQTSAEMNERWSPWVTLNRVALWSVEEKGKKELAKLK